MIFGSFGGAGTVVTLRIAHPDPEDRVPEDAPSPDPDGSAAKHVRPSSRTRVTRRRPRQSARRLLRPRPARVGSCEPGARRVSTFTGVGEASPEDFRDARVSSSRRISERFGPAGEGEASFGGARFAVTAPPHAGTAGGSAGTSTAGRAGGRSFAFVFALVASARRSPSGAFVLAAFAPRAVFFFGSRSEAMSAASDSGERFARRHSTAPRAASEDNPRRNLLTRNPPTPSPSSSEDLCAERSTAADTSGCAPRYERMSRTADGANSHAPGFPRESSSAPRRDAPGDPRRFSPSGTSAGIASTPARETQSTTNPTPKMPSGSFSGRRGSREASICAAVSHASPSAIPVGGALSDQPRAKRSDDGRRYVGGIEHRVTFAPHRETQLRNLSWERVEGELTVREQAGRNRRFVTQSPAGHSSGGAALGAGRLRRE